MRIAVTGGTGFLGSLLIKELLRLDHEVLLLTRQSPSRLEPTPCRIINWPDFSSEGKELLMTAEAVVHLAGESINGLWTKKKKHRIRRSRVHLTRELGGLLKESRNLKRFICASAVGYYGDRKTEVLTENSPPGEGFLARVCRDWEAAAMEIASSTVSVAMSRSGAVLHREHGMLRELEKLYRLKIGGPVAGGDQMISWIHWRDWVNAIIFLLDRPQLQGPFNLVAPEAVSQRTFSAQLARLNNQKIEIPVPGWAVKLALGEMSELILFSQNARPSRLEVANFKFRFRFLKDALDELYGRPV